MIACKVLRFWINTFLLFSKYEEASVSDATLADSCSEVFLALGGILPPGTDLEIETRQMGKRRFDSAIPFSKT